MNLKSDITFELSKDQFGKQAKFDTCKCDHVPWRQRVAQWAKCL